jgi:hypothetical protein
LEVIHGRPSSPLILDKKGHPDQAKDNAHGPENNPLHAI